MDEKYWTVGRQANGVWHRTDAASHDTGGRPWTEPLVDFRTRITPETVSAASVAEVIGATLGDAGVVAELPALPQQSTPTNI